MYAVKSCPISKVFRQVPIKTGCYCTLKRKLALQVERLTTRSLIEISGDNVYTFMQGLITNDITHLNLGQKSIFTCFLNNRGRVLYDSLIYRTKSDNTLLIECDAAVQNDLKNHLKMFRVRRKINVDISHLQVWVGYSVEDVVIPPVTDDIDGVRSIEVTTLCEGVSAKQNSEYENLLTQESGCEEVSIYPDPRINHLGVRIIVPESVDVSKINKTVQLCSYYKMLRYMLGVGEGVNELPPGNCFPLEVNCDYLHGVSFHKGCYIGQELTARTHHTGVVRKRLMPLVLNSEKNDYCNNLAFDTPVEIEGSDKKVGKLRGVSGRYAIGLIRIAEALEAPSKIKVGSISAYTFKPSWWPQQNKESAFSSK